MVYTRLQCKWEIIIGLLHLVIDHEDLQSPQDNESFYEKYITDVTYLSNYRKMNRPKLVKNMSDT